jgi:hypothetical protein
VAPRGPAEEGGRGLPEVSRPRADLWLSRYAAQGVAGLLDRSHAAPREQVPARIRARVLALTRTGPPAETGLSHWSSREMARFIVRTEGVSVSHHWIALQIPPHRRHPSLGRRPPRLAQPVDHPGPGARRNPPAARRIRGRKDRDRVGRCYIPGRYRECLDCAGVTP